MTNLIKLTNTDIASVNYDWNQIENNDDRTFVKSEVEGYQQAFEQNLKLAQQIIVQDTVAKAKCVYNIKGRLTHGQFSDVCTAMGIDRNTRSALVSIHKCLQDGADSDDVLAMVAKMEPQAASKLLKSDKETQKKLVSNYQQTGRTPSNRTFFEQRASQARQAANYDQLLDEAFDDCQGQSNDTPTPVAVEIPEHIVEEEEINAVKAVVNVMPVMDAIAPELASTISKLESIIETLDQLRLQDQFETPQAQRLVELIGHRASMLLGNTNFRR